MNNNPYQYQAPYPAPQPYQTPPPYQAPVPSAPLDPETEKDLKAIKLARLSLLILSCSSLLNVILPFLGIYIIWYFSYGLPINGLLTATTMDQLISAIITGLFCIGSFFLYWGLSKKHPGWLIVAFVCLCADFIWILDFILVPSNFADPTFVLFILCNTATRVAVLFLLWKGIAARKRLKASAQQVIMGQQQQFAYAPQPQYAYPPQQQFGYDPQQQVYDPPQIYDPPQEIPPQV